MTLDANNIKVNSEKPESDDPEKEKENQQFIEMMPWTQEDCKTRMEEINKAVKDVSDATETNQQESPDTPF